MAYNARSPGGSVTCIYRWNFHKRWSQIDQRRKSGVGGHVPRGPETKRFKSLTTETDDDSARRLFPSGRRISGPPAHAAHPGMRVRAHGFGVVDS